MIFSCSATIEIGRYQSHMKSVHDRFVGYHVQTENCRHKNYPANSTECFHIGMELGLFDNISRLYAFQLGKLKIKKTIMIELP